ncbi:EAL domain-containing protein [Candidatus Soleaferrea massiliensis]|uniref:EAL domain-containing protein n=1 Tax=Candidatus Soleaferrea massiliensis TaxID=1470354 RepID=UPI0006946705|nr:EAL domain-containing protein [Candidatus Soleaferrea massiliensis]
MKVTNTLIMLIVDGNTDSRLLLKGIFDKKYHVLETKSCAETMKQLRGGVQVDIVILDMNTPDIDDYNIIKKIRKSQAMRRIPVVVVANCDDMRGQHKALQMGAIDVITKPYKPETVQYRVENILSSIRESSRLEEAKWRTELTRISQIDPKTGIWNKESFCSKTQKYLKEHADGEYVIARWDIDNFKVFNDTFGVAAGDQLLLDIGEKYMESKKGNGLHGGLTYGHWDADHFVSLWASSQLEAQKLYEHTLEQLCQVYPDYNFSIRLGLYRVESPLINVGVMCDRALMALNSIKGNYRKNYAWYDESMRMEIVEEQEIDSTMKQALSNGEFIVYYQPQYNYDTGGIIGAEALIRWLHPQKGILLPGKFIPVFERNGFICEMDRYMWERVCIQIRQWHDKGIPLPSISVNVSRRDFYLPDLVDIFKDLVSKYRLTPDMLHLEITESAYMENPKQLIRIVAELQKCGFHIEMDDFGSGYSSLNMLKDVPVDILKLDMKFIAEDIDSDRGGNILSAIVRMAHSIKLPVIAEGVETYQHAEYLKSISCFFMQGHYFSKPLPVEEFEKLLIEKYDDTHKGKCRFHPGIDGSIDFLNTSAQATLLFNTFMGGAVILEYEKGNIAALRINDKFLKELGATRQSFRTWQYHIQDRFPPDQRSVFIEMLETAIRTDDEADCTIYSYPLVEGGEPIWTYCRVRCLAEKAGSYIFYHYIENVTKRKKLEIHNSELTEQLTVLVNSIPGAVQDIRIFPNGTELLYFNEVAATMFGYTLDEYPNLYKGGIKNAIHPEDTAKILEVTDSVLNGTSRSDTGSITFRHICKDASYRWVQMNAVILKREGDGVVVTTVMIDITEQKRLEASLARDKTEIQTIINSIPSGLAVFRYMNGKVHRTYLSEGAYRILGYTEDDRPSLDMNDAMSRVHPDDFAKLRIAVAAATRSRQRFNFDMRVLSKAGGIRWVNLIANPVVLDGDNLYFYGIYTDITFRKSAEELRLASETELNQVMENAPGGVCRWRLDAPMYLEFISEGTLRMNGYSYEDFRDLTKADPLAIVLSEDREYVRSALNHLREQPQTMTIEYRFLHQNGSVRYAMDTLRSVRGEDCVMRAYAQIFDVTEQHRAQDALRIREEEYQTAVKFSDRMIYRYLIADHCMELSEETATMFGIPTSLPDAPNYFVSAGIVASESVDKWLDFFNRIECGDRVGTAECRTKGKDSEYCWFRMEFNSVFGQDNKPVSAIVTCKEVTDERILDKNKAFGFAGIYKAISIEYPLSIAVNLTQNNYHILESDTFFVKKMAEHGVYDQFVEDIIKTIQEEDKKAFRTTFSRQNLLDAFGQGKNTVRLEHRQVGDDGVLHWVETIVLRVNNPYDDDVLEITLFRIIDNQKKNEAALKSALKATSDELTQSLYFCELIDRFSPEMIILRYQTGGLPPIMIGNLPRKLGYNHEEILSFIQCGISGAVYSEDVDMITKKMREVYDNRPDHYSFEYRIVKKDGELIWLSANGARFVDSKGNVGYITTYLDNTERHNLIDELRVSQESYRLVVENTDRLIYTYNISSKTAYLPEKMRQLLGLPAVVENVPDSVIAHSYISQDSTETYLDFYRNILAGNPCEGEWIFERRASGNNTVWLKARYFLALGGDGKPVTATIYMDDVTIDKLKEDDLIIRAQRDGLTRLYNRSTVEARVQEKLLRGGNYCVLLVLDLDDLKTINDTLGHNEGDRALRAIGDILLGHFRHSDIIGRIGGDEFLIFLPNASGEEGLKNSLSSLLRKLSSIVIGEKDEQSMHCSIGAVLGKTGVDDFSTLYKKADTALYHVKRHGKNDYAFYSPEMEKENYLYQGHSTLPMDGATTNIGELSKMVGAIATYYPLIFSVNLSCNRYSLMEAGEYIASIALKNDNYDDFLEAVKKLLHPDCQEEAMKTMSREALLKAYKEGETSVSFYGERLDSAAEKCGPCEILTVFYINDNGDVCDFTFVRPLLKAKNKLSEKGTL